MLRGIGAVAGQTQEFDWVGRVAAMVVHGVRDSVVSFAGGQRSRDTYLATNGCSNQSGPDAVAPCIDYQGCAEGLPVAWCEHDEATYQDTNHGWPSFASQAIGRFLLRSGRSRNPSSPKVDRRTVDTLQRPRRDLRDRPRGPSLPVQRCSDNLVSPICAQRVAPARVVESKGALALGAACEHRSGGDRAPAAAQALLR